MIQNQSNDRSINSVNVLAKAEYLFNEMRAKLKRLVASQNEILQEIYEKQPTYINLVADIDHNLKINLEDKKPPLKVFISYPDGQAGKSLSVYISHEVKEPNSSMNIGSYINPTCIPIQGSSDPKR